MVRRNMTRPKLRPVRIALLIGFLGAAGSPGAMAAADAQGWITDADAGARKPVVLHFRREFELGQVPRTLPVEVTADNRFILFVNGRRVASVPVDGPLA